MSKQLSSQAAAAQMIRQELKAAFPSVPFKVTSKSFSMGNDVSIRWTDGPTTREVEAIADKYQQGHFDGMIDLYEYSNSRDDIPQAKYVMTTRHASNDATRAMVDWLNRTFGYELTVEERSSYGDATYLHIGNDKPRGNGSGWQSNDVHRYMQATNLLCPACNAPALPADAYCSQCGAVQQPIPLNV